MHAATVGRLKNHEEISGSSKLLVLYIYIYNYFYYYLSSVYL